MLYALVDYSNKKRIFGGCLAEEILGEVKISVPKTSNESRLSRILLKNFEKYKVQNVVLNDELKNKKYLCDSLLDKRKYIVTGNRMGKILLPKMIEDIAKYTKIEKAKLKIVLLMNEYSIENLDLIECISKDIKQLSIVSKNYTKYEKISEKLYEKYGYMIKLYDSNTKDFIRDNIIINMDFKQEELKKMLFTKYSIVISLNEKITELRKNFEGIVINDIDILGVGIPSEHFRKLAVCEAKLYRPLRKIKDNERVFFMEKYKINGYFGKSGKITGEEFEKVGKNYSIHQ